MSFKYVIGLAYALAGVNAISAQTGQPTGGQRPAQPQAQARPAPATQSLPYPTSIYRMNDVSKSLNLSQDQMNNLNKLTDQTQAQYRNDYSKLSTLNNADQFSRLQELNRQYNGDWNKGAQSIFNENQWNRYQQLNHQYGGFNTLYDANVQKQLNLTPNQIKNLDEQRTWSNQQLQEINRLGTTDPTKATQMYRDYWKQHQERLNNFLTPTQQKAWQQMTGEAYNFQPSFTGSN